MNADYEINKSMTVNYVINKQELHVDMWLT